MDGEHWRDEFQEYALLLEAVASGDRSRVVKLFGDYILGQRESAQGSVQSTEEYQGEEYHDCFGEDQHFDEYGEYQGPDGGHQDQYGYDYDDGHFEENGDPSTEGYGHEPYMTGALEESGETYAEQEYGGDYQHQHDANHDQHYYGEEDVDGYSNEYGYDQNHGHDQSMDYHGEYYGHSAGESDFHTHMSQQDGHMGDHVAEQAHSVQDIGVDPHVEDDADRAPLEEESSQAQVMSPEDDAGWAPLEEESLQPQVTAPEDEPEHVLPLPDEAYFEEDTHQYPHDAFPTDGEGIKEHFKMGHAQDVADDSSQFTNDSASRRTRSSDNESMWSNDTGRSRYTNDSQTSSKTGGLRYNPLRRQAGSDPFRGTSISSLLEAPVEGWGSARALWEMPAPY